MVVDRSFFSLGRISQAGLIAFALGMLLGACGRTAPRFSALDGGARQDGRIPVPDGFPRVDGGIIPLDTQPSDGPVIVDSTCNPGCAELCELAAEKCGVLAPPACLAACPGFSSAQTACLAGAYCGVTSRDPCAAAKQCLETPPPDKPDLTITAFSANVSGTTVRYDLTACNLGGAGAPGFFVDLYYDRSLAPAIADYGDQYEQHSALLPGTCGVISFTRTATPAGDYISWAQIDSDANIDEASEENNVAGPLKVNVGAMNPPDLVITSFTHSMTTPTRVRYSVQVCNVGGSTSASTYVHVYYDLAAAPAVGDLGDHSRSISALAPGACRTRAVTRPGTPPGLYQSWAQVDPGNQVPEQDETNNVDGPRIVQVGDPNVPDLAFAYFDAQAQGSDVTYKAEICNKSTVAAGSFRVDIYFTRPNPPPDAPGDDFIAVPALAAGSCTPFTLTRTATPDGTYVSWARLDVGNQVPEVNENNNIAGPAVVTVGPPLSDCAAVCTFATNCGVFTSDEYLLCFTWCTGLTISQRACVDTAVKNGSCSAFTSCDTPPPPPPPPPPGVCPEICNFVIDDCSLLPASQYWACIGLCQSLPPDKINCALQAKATNQCMQTVTCLF